MESKVKCCNSGGQLNVDQEDAEAQTHDSDDLDIPSINNLSASQKSDEILKFKQNQVATIEYKPKEATNKLTAQLAQNFADELTIKPTYKRYIILILFALNSANKSYQWLQVTSSTSKAVVLYQTDTYMIYLSSILFMLAFILLGWPACYIIENIGIRKAVLMASIGTACGSTIKCFSCNDHGIWLLMIGQIFVSCSEQLIFSLPSRLASVWFPDHQVSLCVALCVVGNQIGLAMGFIIPQCFLNGMDSREEIAIGFYRMFLATAVFSITVTLICILLFDNEPSNVPGAARLKQLELEKKLAAKRLNLRQKLASLYEQICQLFCNKQLMLLSASYGIIVGIGYTIQTLLEQMLQPIWPDNELVVGNTGFLIIVAGILATPIWGRAMDRWHAFKSINLIIAIGVLLSLVLFAYAMVYLESALALYIAAVLVGLFQTGFIVSGLEFAVELTYPAPELVTSSVMNIMPQFYSIFSIFLGTYIKDIFGVLALNIFNILSIVLGLIFLISTREILKRQEAIAQMNEKPLATRRPLAHA